MRICHHFIPSSTRVFYPYALISNTVYFFESQFYKLVENLYILFDLIFFERHIRVNSFFDQWIFYKWFYFDCYFNQTLRIPFQTILAIFFYLCSIVGLSRRIIFHHFFLSDFQNFDALFNHTFFIYFLKINFNY